MNDWSPPPEPLILAPGEAHVWRASLALSEPQLVRSLELLSEDERARAARFHFPRDANRYIAGRATLRRILAAYTGLPASQLRFSYGPQGKPSLHPQPAAPDLSFNLSHSASMALYAIGLGFNLGIDIEQLDRSIDIDGIAGRYFCPPEVAMLSGLPPGERHAGFFYLWTRKEACVKARGQGLSIPLNEFDVLSGCPAGGWIIYHLEPGSGYAAALVTNRELVNLRCFDWPESSSTK